MSDPRSRILLITRRYPPQKGGMAVSCERLAAGLRRRDVLLDVVAFTDLAAKRKVTKVDKDGGADLHVVLEASPGMSAQMAWNAVRQRHSRAPYSFVIGFGSNLPGLTAVTLGSWLGLKSLVLVRGNDFDRDWFDPRLGFQVREALSRADHVGAVSTEKVRRIKALFPEADVRWTPNGVDPRDLELLPEDVKKRDEIKAELGGEDRRIIGIFGESKFKKRIPLWLEGVRDAGLMGRIGLLVVGSVDEETALILDDPALAPRNLRSKYIQRDRLPGYYAACDFVAIPSLYEGMPNALLEAMAAGIVPIASDAGALPDVIEDGRTGFLFPAEDRAAAGMVTAKALSLSDEDLAAMKERTRKHAEENFTIGRELDVIMEIVREGENI